ncbi:hypothetical protein BKA65DRAFT_556930 [Rhexocercosporidium sp. MPI-PUGE-AT-0058]|nr:hypothetical protein BKA65DRAFT_556930 [Rhexocercosporidium sp. MPI-PUGE-AT-0058]
MKASCLRGVYLFLAVLNICIIVPAATSTRSLSSSTRTPFSSKSSSTSSLPRGSSSSKKSSSTLSTVSRKSTSNLSPSTLSKKPTSTIGTSSSKTSSVSKSSSSSSSTSRKSSSSSTSSSKLFTTSKPTSTSGKSTSTLSSWGKSSTSQSSRSSSTTSSQRTTSSKNSAFASSSLESTGSRSVQSSSSLRSSTSSKTSSSSRSSSSSVRTSSALTSATVSSSTQAPSITVVTPTGCPWVSTGTLIWQNATSETSAFGIYGTFDQYGYPATATRLGIWNGSRISSQPDLIIDITNPAIVTASFTKDLHNVIFDTVNNQMHVSNCSVEAIVPIPATIKKRHPTPEAAYPVQERQVYSPAGSIKITLTYATPCGNPDQWQNPTIDCGNETPGLWPNKMPQSQVIQTAPGVYSSTCFFPNLVDGRRNSLLCQNIYPALTSFCDTLGIPETQVVLQGICAIIAATLVLELLAAICEAANLSMDLYCAIQNSFNGGQYGSGFKDALCGPDVSSTDLGIRVVSDYPHDTWYNPALDLGHQNSQSPKDINIAVPNKVSAGATCTPCKNSNQQWLTPWVQVYAGNLFLRNNFPCSGFAYSGYLGDSSQYTFASAQAECQIIAEQNMASVWFADSETFTNNDGSPPSGPFFGCWVTGCDITAGDFSLDFNALNPSSTSFVVEDVVAFHRTVEWVNCVS